MVMVTCAQPHSKGVVRSDNQVCEIRSPFCVPAPSSEALAYLSILMTVLNCSLTPRKINLLQLAGPSE